MAYSAVGYHDQLRQSPGLSDAAFRVAVLLSGYADTQGRCWPSQRRLAAQLRWSLRKVERSIGELQSAGVAVYLTRARHKGEHSIIQLRTTVESDTADRLDGGSTKGTTDRTDSEPPSDLTRTTVTDGGRNSPMNSPKELPHAPARELAPGELATRAQEEEHDDDAVRAMQADLARKARADIAAAKAEADAKHRELADKMALEATP